MKVQHCPDPGNGHNNKYDETDNKPTYTTYVFNHLHTRTNKHVLNQL